MIPLVSYFEGDFVHLLLVADEEGTVAEMAAACAAEVVGKRIAPQDRELQVVFADKVIDSQARVREAGIGPMDVVYVGYA